MDKPPRALAGPDPPPPLAHSSQASRHWPSAELSAAGSGTAKAARSTEQVVPDQRATAEKQQKCAAGRRRRRHLQASWKTGAADEKPPRGREPPSSGRSLIAETQSPVKKIAEELSIVIDVKVGSWRSRRPEDAAGAASDGGAGHRRGPNTNQRADVCIHRHFHRGQLPRIH